MNYLILQITTSLLLVGLLGLLLGWWLGRRSAGSRVGSIVEDWQQRLSTAELEALEAQQDVQTLNAQLTDTRIDVEKANERSEMVAANLAESERLLTEERKRVDAIKETSTTETENLRGEIETWREELAALERDQIESQDATDRLAAELATSNDRAIELEAEAARVRHQLAEVERSRAPSTEGTALTAEVERLRKVKTDFQEWMLGEASREEEFRHARRQLAAVTTERDALALQLADAEGRASRAQAASDQANHELEALLASPLVDVGRTGTIDVPMVEVLPAVSSGDTEGSAADTGAAASAGPELLEAPRGASDDLQKIRGIGEVLEQTLNRLGVYHFRQIAGWSSSDVEWIASHINTFPDRIERDAWIAQATRLQAEKYSQS